ncbi:MAG TPA: cupredoxin family copper-binding protein [Pirellulales bacterium]|jgi:plastocyanin|nr:cupredoxin family copper-binding protein [Pirellulales bacterium]
MLAVFGQWKATFKTFQKLTLGMAMSSSLLVLNGCFKSQAEKPTSAAATANHETVTQSVDVASAANPGTDSSAAPNQVTIDNFAFNPQTLTVHVGTKVTWINHDDVPHTATSAVKPTVFDSKALDTDDKFSFVFTAPGTYPYFCAVHPHMTGEIVVK